ncbi:UNVERIFIED_CONTAM: protein TAR1 [Sesamum calycinum]|uniref:Protein TAR1 n=1 Tax=Sesamum calycinum TaxID=2727403 RepID=A0AAW2LAB1_9LAMI
MSDSLVRVSRRVEWGARWPAPGARSCRSTPKGARCPPRSAAAYRLPGLWPPPQSALVRAPSRSADRLSPFHIRPGRIAAPIRFPPDNFKHSLTLFSKSFSSFPRGTCSLSVSRPYLALDGIYRPIGAAFPNNPTRRQRLVVRQGPGTTGLSPSRRPFPGDLARSAAEDASPDYNSDGEAARFSSWAIPGSLAVTRGILTSPPHGRPADGGTARRTLRLVFLGAFRAGGFDNDPSAGSPTETLLRLLLPLNDKVQWTSRDVAGSEPPTSPRSEHFTGPFNRLCRRKNSHCYLRPVLSKKTCLLQVGFPFAGRTGYRPQPEHQFSWLLHQLNFGFPNRSRNTSWGAGIPLVFLTCSSPFSPFPATTRPAGEADFCLAALFDLELCCHFQCSLSFPHWEPTSLHT